MPPGTSSSTIGAGGALPGLHEREQLEALVERAEAAGQQHERVRLLDEGDLAGEEVAEVDELRVVGEELRGRRLERQPDAHAERVGRARALDARLHDPGPGAGDDHPVGVGELAAPARRSARTAGRRAGCGPSRRSRPCAPAR